MRSHKLVAACLVLFIFSTFSLSCSRKEKSESTNETQYKPNTLTEKKKTRGGYSCLTGKVLTAGVASAERVFPKASGS